MLECELCGEPVGITEEFEFPFGDKVYLTTELFSMVGNNEGEAVGDLEREPTSIGDDENLFVGDDVEPPETSSSCVGERDCACEGAGVF